LADLKKQPNGLDDLNEWKKEGAEEEKPKEETKEAS